MDKIFGIRIDKRSENEVLETVKKIIDTSKKLQIVTLNTELLVASKNDKKLVEILNRALVLPESSGIYLAEHYSSSETQNKYLRLLSSGWKTVTGAPTELAPRLPGVDLCYSLAGLCQEFGYKLALLGGAEGVAVEAARRLKQTYPKLKVTGLYGGLVGVDDKKIITELEKTQPDVVFVAFGQPTQEYWIAENLQKTSANVAVGVGGTLDFMAGRVPRAPKLVRNFGMEWAFRLAVQPWRAKRQASLIKFINLLLKSN